MRPEITYELFIDCGRSIKETARQSGLSESTVRRHVRVMTRPEASQEDQGRSRRVDEIFERLSREV